MRWFVFVLCALLPQASSDPLALQRMAATERAFAAAAAEIGVRDAFLTFFADDAVSIQPGATAAAVAIVRAKDGLVASPLPKLPLGATLMWAPYTGHVSADGTMGWLTGGYASLTTTTREIAAQGAYFSVWRRQADSTWRVWLDEGIPLPDVWRDAAPFRVAPEPDAGPGASTETVEAAERRVSAGGDGWRAALGADVRVHRAGLMPAVGRDAVVAWSRQSFATVKYTVARTLVAGSDDLAIAMGGYDASTSAGPEVGTWVRVWKRAMSGAWRIVFETNRKTSR